MKRWRWRSWARRAASLGFTCIAVAAVTGTICGFADSLWWAFGLLDHFRIQYIFMLLAALLGHVILRLRKQAIVWLLALLTNVAVISTVPSTQAVSPRPTSLRVLHLNVDRHNRDAKRVIAAVESSHADAVFLQEITPWWLDRLRGGLTRYRVAIAEPRSNTRGVAMLIRLDSEVLIAARILQLVPQQTDRPIVTAELSLDGHTLHVMSLHVKRPSSAAAAELQAQEFVAAAKWATALGNQPKMVVGDFNATPWSRRVRDLRNTSGIKPTANAWSGSTWPAQTPWPLRIPIDLTLSSGLSACQPQVGEDVGSDHLPLVVDCTFD